MRVRAGTLHLPGLARVLELVGLLARMGTGLGGQSVRAAVSACAAPTSAYLRAPGQPSQPSANGMCRIIAAQAQPAQLRWAGWEEGLTLASCHSPVWSTGCAE